VSQSQNIKPLLKESIELPSKEKSAGLKVSQWDLEDEDIFASLNEPNQSKENKEKGSESVSPKPGLTQGKPIVPNFGNHTFEVTS